jgi:hypothetical protein
VFVCETYAIHIITKHFAKKGFAQAENVTRQSYELSALSFYCFPGVHLNRKVPEYEFWALILVATYTA